jgi:predicted RNase H-like HicB family nuclease
MSRERSYDYIVWQDEGVWTAHCPSIPGVYGLGDTKGRAEKDLIEGLDTLFDYLHETGEA